MNALTRFPRGLAGGHHRAVGDATPVRARAGRPPSALDASSASSWELAQDMGHALGRMALRPTDARRRKGLDEVGLHRDALPAARTVATAGAVRYRRSSNHVAGSVDGAKAFAFDREKAEAAAVST